MTRTLPQNGGGCGIEEERAYGINLPRDGRWQEAAGVSVRGFGWEAVDVGRPESQASYYLNADRSEGLLGTTSRSRLVSKD